MIMSQCRDMISFIGVCVCIDDFICVISVFVNCLKCSVYT